MLVVGCAKCVWDDLDRFTHGGKKINFDTIAINNIIPFIPWTIHHAASYHASFLKHWIEVRKVMQPKKEAEIHSHSTPRRDLDGVTFVWDFDHVGGSSGLLATYVALALGYKRVVLAGIPLDGSGRFHDAPWLDPDDHTVFHGNYLSRTLFLEWQHAKNECFKGRVRSLSGRTMKWLGGPDD